MQSQNNKIAEQSKNNYNKSDSVQFCDEGHPLILTPNKDLEKEDNGYANGWICSRCKKYRYINVVPLHCSKCKYDLCEDCDEELTTQQNDEFYSNVFGCVDKANVGFVQGGQIFGLMLSSGLNKKALADIWDEATQRQSGGLNVDKFIVAMKLIALAQKGFEATRDSLQKQMLPIPRARMKYPKSKFLKMIQNDQNPNVESKPSSNPLYAAERLREQLRSAEQREKLARNQAGCYRIDFEKVSRQNELLNVENDKLKESINEWKELMQTKDSCLVLLEAEVDSLRVEVYKYENESQSNDLNSSQIIQQKQSDIISLKQQLKNAKKREGNLVKERNKFEDECKEIMMKYNEIKRKYDEQRKLILLDPTNYKQWSYNDVVQWIVSLDKMKYKKYEKALQIGMKQEHFTGEQLRFVDKSDLHRFGVTEFGDKIALIQHIQSLTKNKQFNDDDSKKQKEVEGRNNTAFIG